MMCAISNKEKQIIKIEERLRKRRTQAENKISNKEKQIIKSEERLRKSTRMNQRKKEKTK